MTPRLVAAFLLAGIATLHAGNLPAFDRARLPAALQNVNLDHASSGLVMMLDRGGDLVQAPSPAHATGSAAEQEAVAVALAGSDYHSRKSLLALQHSHWKLSAFRRGRSNEQQFVRRLSDESIGHTAHRVHEVDQRRPDLK